MSGAQSPCRPNDPLMLAWKAHEATEDFRQSLGWALQIAPMVQAGAPDAHHVRRFELMPFEQRKWHAEGSLWAAFCAGYRAALAGKEG